MQAAANASDIEAHIKDEFSRDRDNLRNELLVSRATVLTDLLPVFTHDRPFSKGPSQPRHSLKPLSTDISVVVGPHTFSHTKLFLAQWTKNAMTERQSRIRRKTPNEDGRRQRRKKQDSSRRVNSYFYADGLPRFQLSLDPGHVDPVQVTPLLISRLNVIASRDPVLASVLSRVASKQAHPSEVASLGHFMNRLSRIQQSFAPPPRYAPPYYSSQPLHPVYPMARPPGLAPYVPPAVTPYPVPYPSTIQPRSPVMQEPGITGFAGIARPLGLTYLPRRPYPRLATRVRPAVGNGSHSTATESAPVPGTSVGDASVGDTSVGDTSVGDTSVVDTSVAGTSVGDTSVAGTSVADRSVADAAATDTPAAGTPRLDADTSIGDTPVAATPIADTPAADTSITDTSVGQHGSLADVSSVTDNIPISSSMEATASVASNISRSAHGSESSSESEDESGNESEHGASPKEHMPESEEKYVPRSIPGHVADTPVHNEEAEPKTPEATPNGTSQGVVLQAQEAPLQPAEVGTASAGSTREPAAADTQNLQDISPDATEFPYPVEANVPMLDSEEGAVLPPVFVLQFQEQSRETFAIPPHFSCGDEWKTEDGTRSLTIGFFVFPSGPRKTLNDIVADEELQRRRASVAPFDHLASTFITDSEPVPVEFVLQGLDEVSCHLLRLYSGSYRRTIWKNRYQKCIEENVSASLHAEVRAWDLLIEVVAFARINEAIHASKTVSKSGRRRVDDGFAPLKVHFDSKARDQILAIQRARTEKEKAEKEKRKAEAEKERENRRREKEQRLSDAAAHLNKENTQGDSGEQQQEPSASAPETGEAPALPDASEVEPSSEAPAPPDAPEIESSSDAPAPPDAPEIEPSGAPAAPE